VLEASCFDITAFEQWFHAFAVDPTLPGFFATPRRFIMFTSMPAWRWLTEPIKPGIL
jgi:hypothetical protein